MADIYHNNVPTPQLDALRDAVKAGAPPVAALAIIATAQFADTSDQPRQARGRFGFKPSKKNLTQTHPENEASVLVEQLYLHPELRGIAGDALSERGREEEGAILQGNGHAVVFAGNVYSADSAWMHRTGNESRQFIAYPNSFERDGRRFFGITLRIASHGTCFELQFPLPLNDVRRMGREEHRRVMIVEDLARDLYRHSTLDPATTPVKTIFGEKKLRQVMKDWGTKSKFIGPARAPMVHHRLYVQRFESMNQSGAGDTSETNRRSQLGWVVPNKRVPEHEVQTMLADGWILATPSVPDNPHIAQRVAEGTIPYTPMWIPHHARLVAQIHDPNAVWLAPSHDTYEAFQKYHK